MMKLVELVPMLSEDQPWYLAGGINKTNAIGIYQAHAAESIEDSYINLANPGTYDLTAGIAPTWDSVNGWTFTGTQHLLTGIQPIKQSWSMVIKYTDAVFVASTNKYLAGAGSSASIVFGLGTFAVATVKRGLFASGTPATAANGQISAVTAISAGLGYQNGTAVATLVPGTGDIGANDIYIGCANLAGVASSFVTAKIQALAIYDTILTAAQIVGVTNSLIYKV